MSAWRPCPKASIRAILAHALVARRKHQLTGLWPPEPPLDDLLPPPPPSVPRYAPGPCGLDGWAKRHAFAAAAAFRGYVRAMRTAQACADRISAAGVHMAEGPAGGIAARYCHLDTWLARGVAATKAGNLAWGEMGRLYEALGIGHKKAPGRGPGKP